MTARVRHLTVILDEDYRIDDLDAIRDAIYMIKGVEHVQHHLLDINTSLAKIIAKADLKREILEILKP